MFAKIFAIFALIAVALAAPSPNPAPEPKPQYLTNATGLDYAYPAYPAAAYAPSVVSPYAAPAALAYSGYPAVSTYYLRK